MFIVPEKLFLKNISFPELPPAKGDSIQPGLAGPIAGTFKNFVFVGGGANFANGLPWRGGEKVFHDEIYLMEKSAAGEMVWKQSQVKLPFAMAYSACVSAEQGIIAVGGETENGLLAEVSLFSVRNGNVSRKSLPLLPQATTSASATLIGDTVFVAGGLTKDGATSAFYSFNMKEPEKGWLVLPELPVALSHAVMVSQRDSTEMCVFVIGGRNKTSELSTFFSSIWKYRPTKQQWTYEGDIISEGKPLCLSAGTGIAAGSEHILLFGGDPGIYFNQTESLNNAIEKISGKDEKQKIWKEKDEMLSNHPGFSKDILVFNTHSKIWTIIDRISGESPVTTSAFSWDGTIVIPSGEVRPGIRTSKVIGFDIQIEK